MANELSARKKKELAAAFESLAVLCEDLSGFCAEAALSGAVWRISERRVQMAVFLHFRRLNVFFAVEKSRLSFPRPLKSNFGTPMKSIARFRDGEISPLGPQFGPNCLPK